MTIERELLQRLATAANTVEYCYTRRPDNFALALTEMKNVLFDVNAELEKPQEAGKADDTSDGYGRPLCDIAEAGKEAGKVEAVAHWMPIDLLGASASFQRAARRYAEEYAARLLENNK